MDFAANAVADFIAPPPRPATAKPADTSDSSFDDHLDDHLQATRDADAQDTRDARDAARADQADRAADRADDADRVDDAAAADREQTREAAADATDEHIADKPDPEAHPPHAPQPPAPLVVQLIASAAQPESPSAQTTPPVAATSVAPTPPPEVQVVVAEATPSTPNASNTTKKGAARDADTKTAETEGAATPDAATQTLPVAAPVQPTAPQVQTQSGETDSKADTIAPANAAPTRDAPTRAPKADAGAKFEVPEQSGHAATDDTAQSPPSSSTPAKPTNPSRPAVAAPQAADAQATAPLSTSGSTPATASIQAPVQTQHVAATDESGLRTAPVASQVGHEIVRRFDGRTTSFDIRLDPPELGRVDVRLEVSRDQRVTATISADTPQALHQLARHARDLEQTLQSAGLQLSDSGLSFDLRQGNDGRAQNNNDSATPASTSARADASTPDQTPIARPRLESWRGVRLDMMV